MTFYGTYEERLTVVLLTNPSYGEKIISFMENNPEFLKVGHLISLTEYPVNYNKNPGEKFNPEAPTCIFEQILYYVAESGVNSNYGRKQWKFMFEFMRDHQDSKDVMSDLLSHCDSVEFKIQPKKRSIYESLKEQLEELDVLPYELTYEQAMEMCKNTKGIGNGCITHLAMLYGDDKDVTPDYTDRGFVEGFQKFYKLDHKPTKKEMLGKTKKWSDTKGGIKIGNSIINQCFHYL